MAATVVVPTLSVVAKLPGLAPRWAVRAATNAVDDDLRRSPLPPLAAGAEIVVVARLHPDKGLDVLNDALALDRQEVPAATVRVLGPAQDGFEHLGDELTRRAGERGVAGAFSLAGFVDDPMEAVRRARCYVQPARERTEILPLAVLEAMAAGTAVVATDVGGLADVVHHERTGLLVAPEHPTALAAAIVRVLRDDGLAERLRSAAHDLVAGPPFGEDDLVATMADVYDGAVRG
jgi:glycosyltransferase involved in cell wall biosynthesis